MLRVVTLHLVAQATPSLSRCAAAVARRYDEAEEAYRRMGRPDLAIDLRAKLGDWFKVELLLKQSNGSDAALAECWQRIGQYYADRQKWAKAAQYYAQVRISLCPLTMVVCVPIVTNQQRPVVGCQHPAEQTSTTAA